MFSKKLAILGTATASAVLLAAPSSLAGTIQTESISIDVSGYDLTTDAGSAAIVKKIENAAKKVCHERSGPQSLAERRSIDKCIDTAVSGALDSLSAERQRQAAAKAAATG
ncbi:MAG: UrcA family protein [Henriciella sp.]|uniref:UrcA family protein n=1 Tax=Henriciella sp. TaxID=1968823 RepID=UPI003C7382D3